jgi:hypothetical protein
MVAHHQGRERQGGMTVALWLSEPRYSDAFTFRHNRALHRNHFMTLFNRDGID